MYARDKYSQGKKVLFIPLPIPLALEKPMVSLQSKLCQQVHHCALTVRVHLWEIFKPWLFGFPLPV